MHLLPHSLITAARALGAPTYYLEVKREDTSGGCLVDCYRLANGHWLTVTPEVAVLYPLSAYDDLLTSLYESPEDALREYPL